MSQNYLNRNSPNSLIGRAEDYGALPIKGQYGQYQVGGDLGGREGILDTVYDFMPWRSAERFVDAAQPTVEDNLMGGVNVGLTDKYGVALEATDLLGLGFDVGDIARVGRHVVTPAADMVTRIGKLADDNLRLFDLAHTPITGRNMRGAAGVPPINKVAQSADSLPMDAKAARIAALRAEGNATRFGDDAAEAAEVAEDYRGMHTAPEPMGKSSLDDATDIFPDDVYDPSVSWNYYGHGGSDVAIDKQSASIVSQFRGKPNKPITIYRAVPYEKSASEQLAELEGHMKAYQRRGRVPKAAENGLAKDQWFNDAYERADALREAVAKGEDQAQAMGINGGDWVTINKNYAKQHGESALNGKYKIIQKKVTAKDIHTDGNSIHEWGYSP